MVAKPALVALDAADAVDLRAAAEAEAKSAKAEASAKAWKLKELKEQAAQAKAWKLQLFEVDPASGQ